MQEQRENRAQSHGVVERAAVGWNGDRNRDHSGGSLIIGRAITESTDPEQGPRSRRSGWRFGGFRHIEEHIQGKMACRY